ncbi:hypothetical protein FGG08_000607 [Glutinoglossum americanum]|uniref:Uncharacterized protein n=1 Tax=Glutinoglossum americanum TaxID=1670608 RepID=A0A9P8L132_9PEZI|nr:hypothetical protein FGG08_000607 [Glutinoglossum americanum]
MADEAIDHDTLISQFCEVTSTTPHEAQQYLSVNLWDFPTAIADYFASQDETAAEASAPTDFEDGSSAPPPPRGPRTLDGAPAPGAAPGSSDPSSASGRGKAPKRFATLGDFGSGGAPHSHSDDDDDEDYVDDEGDDKQDFYAGGEKSGIAVQNPNDPRNPARGKSLAEKLVKKATEEARRGGPSSEEHPSSRFTGTGMTLGSDDTPSEAVPDPNAHLPQPTPPLERTLTFWRNGFSVGDGPLMRYDDPANERYLRDIRRGRAPLDLLDVAPGQETNVQVFKRMDEDYTAPKQKGSFRGGGQRLGSPTPGPGTRSQEPSAVPAASASSAAALPASVNIDDSQPTISLQVRLGDGSRLISRFNTTHTVGDVYSFVNQANPASTARPWVLMTTFPSKQLRDKHAVLGELAEFKRGGVVVQKWE